MNNSIQCNLKAFMKSSELLIKKCSILQSKEIKKIMTSQSEQPKKVKVPEPTLRRLPWYLSNVRLLNKKGVEYVSSTQIKTN